jgi:hypothetical protein
MLICCTILTRLVLLSRSSSSSSGSDSDEESDGASGEAGASDRDGAAGAEDGEGGFDDEGLEVDPLYADLLEEIRERPGEDPFQEGLRLGKAYQKMLARQQGEQERRKVMREKVDEVEEKLRPLGAFVAYMASAPLNKYDTLRYTITYKAHKPFTYETPSFRKRIQLHPSSVHEQFSSFPLPSSFLQAHFSSDPSLS